MKMYMANKVRTQLDLDAEQKKVVESRSRATGKSVGQLIREAVDEVYRRLSPVERSLAEDDPIWDYIGTDQSGETDISTHHDAYLYGKTLHPHDSFRM